MILSVYILKCSDGTYYTGITNNLVRRLHEHNEGVSKSAYTYSRRPVNLVYHEDHSDPYSAIRREKQIKGWSRRKKGAIIKGDWHLLRELSRGKKGPSTGSG